MTNSHDERVYTLKEISRKVKLAEQTLRLYARTGRLKAVKFGREYRVTEANLALFMNGAGN